MPELWFGLAADRALDELAADGSRQRFSSYEESLRRG